MSSSGTFMHRPRSQCTVVTCTSRDIRCSYLLLTFLLFFLALSLRCLWWFCVSIDLFAFHCLLTGLFSPTNGKEDKTSQNEDETKGMYKRNSEGSVECDFTYGHVVFILLISLTCLLFGVFLSFRLRR